LESVQKAIAVNPNSARTWIVRGFSLHNLEKYEESIVCYARAIELNPHGADGRKAWNNRGAALDNLHRHKEAIESYEEAIMIDPFDVLSLE
jgi:tetratricopeptide (TPR) repeat protein